MCDIEAYGGRVFYTDTDSVITDLDIMRIPELKKKWCWDGTGDALGTMKSERGYVEEEGVKFSKSFDKFASAGSKMYFIADTTYFE